MQNGSTTGNVNLYEHVPTVVFDNSPMRKEPAITEHVLSGKPYVNGE